MATTPIMSIDVPFAGSILIQPFTIGGWAIDTGAGSGTGVNQVDLWAYPPIGSPTFLGTATYGVDRPDVATAYGAQFEFSGYAFTVPASTLPIGAYTIYAFAKSTVTGTFNDSRTVALAITVARPAALTINPPTLQWFLHRCDVRPSHGQTS